MKRIVILLTLFLLSVACDKRDFTNPVASGVELETPGNLKATQVGEWIKLDWDTQKDVTSGWIVERKTGSAQFTQLIALETADLVTYTDTTSVTGAAYNYRIQGYSDENKTGYSEPVSFTAQFLEPTDLSASMVSDSKIKLAWTDNCNFEQGYRVEKNIGSGFTQIAEVAFNITTFTDSAVQWDNEQAYRVLAFTASNQSEYSNETPYLNLSIAAAPTELQVEEDVTELSLNWQDNCGFEEGFVLERSDNGGSWAQIANLPANTTEYSDTGLQAETPYSYRIYAHVAGKKSIYSNEISGQLPITVTDIDGNVYRAVRIGNQVWMAENLKVTHYRNGDPIPNVTSNSEWNNLNTGAYCNNDNNVSYAKTYGRLYNWYAVDDSNNIAPEGWHVPTDEEWKELEMYLGMSQSEADDTGHRGTDEGSKLKTTNGWYSGGNGTNSSGFSALPGGYRFGFTFGGIGYKAEYWTATECTSSSAWRRNLDYQVSDIYRTTYGTKQAGYSLRLVRD